MVLAGPLDAPHVLLPFLAFYLDHLSLEHLLVFLLLVGSLHDILLVMSLLDQLLLVHLGPPLVHQPDVLQVLGLLFSLAPLLLQLDSPERVLLALTFLGNRLRCEDFLFAIFVDGLALLDRLLDKHGFLERPLDHLTAFFRLLLFE